MEQFFKIIEYFLHENNFQLLNSKNPLKHILKIKNKFYLSKLNKKIKNFKFTNFIKYLRLFNNKYKN